MQSHQPNNHQYQGADPIGLQPRAVKVEVVQAGQPSRPPSLEQLYNLTTSQWLEANEEQDGWYPINGSDNVPDPSAFAAGELYQGPVAFELFDAVVNYSPPYFSVPYQGREAGYGTGHLRTAWNTVHSLNTRDWADYGSALVDNGAEAETKTPKVPGCTAGQPHARNWTFGTSAFTAYAAMRGSSMETGNPLQTWMAVMAMERHGHDHDHRQHGADDFKREQLKRCVS